MTDSLKWVVTGAAGLILVGAFIGGRVLNSSVPVQTPDGKIVASADNRTGYPAPEVSIVAKIARDQDMEALSHSSSLYGDGYSYSRHGKSTRKKPHKQKVVDTGWPKDADPEMGFMAADDKKLREAEKKAEAADRANGYKNWIAPAPNGR